MVDVEMASFRDGYPSLAEWISRDPDYETFIFRRFDRLAARNLLNLQSELVGIEAKLDRLDEDARVRRDPGLRYWETWEDDLEDPQRPGHEAAIKRKALFNRLEKKMEDYRQYLSLRESDFKLTSW